MSGQLLHDRYNAELAYIRRLAADFAERYPAAAGRLRLERDNPSQDPHVERLIEAFALLTARVQLRLDDEFPELTDALLSVLYPHYLAPVPSMGIVDFEGDPTRLVKPMGEVVAAGKELTVTATGGFRCRYRTCYPVHLWAVTLSQAQLTGPPFGRGVTPPVGALSCLKLRLDAPTELGFDQLQIDALRLHFTGASAQAALLFDMLFGRAIAVTIKPAAGTAGGTGATLDPARALRPVGFEPSQGLLPYPANAFLGYRLLTEYFALPQKFHFVDVGGFADARGAGPLGKAVEVCVYFDREFDRDLQTLAQLVNPEVFRLGATPVVNLFKHACESINPAPTRWQYPVVPDFRERAGYEVYSIDAVEAVDAERRRAFRPFYDFRHGGDRAARETFWYAARRPASERPLAREGPEEDEAQALARRTDRGSEVFLSLVDLRFEAAPPADRAVIVTATCTNRDMAARLPRESSRVQFSASFQVPAKKIHCVVTPEPSLRPLNRRGSMWRLVSHLTLNHLSLTDTGDDPGRPTDGPDKHAARDAMREILRLYDFSDPQPGAGGTASGASPYAGSPQRVELMARVNRQVVEGLVGLSARRVVARVGGPVAGGYARGLEVTAEFEAEQYSGQSVLLFASVLERFLGLYASVNSFTQLVAVLQPGGRVLKRWPPRAGLGPVL